MLTGLDHIAVAVPDLESAVHLWERVTGHRCEGREIVSDQQVEVALIRVGQLRIELVAPISPVSPVARFVAARGSSLHHIALRAECAQEELDRLIAAGSPLIDKVTRKGAENSRIGFVHPRALGGVLLEIVERKPED